MPRQAKNRFHFSKHAIAKLPFADKGFITYHDEQVRGLILLVHKFSKSFYLYKLVGGKPIKPKIGNFPDTSVTEAREKAENASFALMNSMFFSMD